MPARFVAESGGRIVVVAAGTGHAEKYLTADEPGGGAADPAVSPDGRAVWFSRTDGDCAAHLASVPTGGGREEAVPGSGEAGPEERPLPRPGYAQVAFTRTDCDEPTESLFVTDIKGLEGYGQTGLLPTAWSRNGQRLLARSSDGREVRLLTVNNAGAIVDNTLLAPPDRSKDCRLEVVGFSPDDNGGYVALRRCEEAGEGARRSLVLLNRKGRRVGGRRRRPSCRG
jgi:dipeptidyl aminopeptidase/acylaminoacyl peptidase